jgi:hypothetical protein
MFDRPVENFLDAGFSPVELVEQKLAHRDAKSVTLLGHYLGESEGFHVVVSCVSDLFSDESLRRVFSALSLRFVKDSTSEFCMSISSRTEFVKATSVARFISDDSLDDPVFG